MAKPCGLSFAATLCVLNIIYQYNIWGKIYKGIIGYKLNKINAINIICEKIPLKEKPIENCTF